MEGSVEFSPVRTRCGWQVSVDGLSIDVEGAHLDRGVVRGSIAIRQGDTIVYRDTVNLTSAQARKTLLEKLAAKDIVIDERVIVALDEACRQPSRPREDRRGDGGADISETPSLDLAGLRAHFSRWLLIKDSAYLPILTGAVLAHRLGGDPVWLLVVAPPGGTKTEPLRALHGYPGVYPLSDLSARTFASGLDTHGADPSLLARLSNEILVLKDLTTVLEKHRDERQAILAQLREIYDGRFDRAWGTGREFHWEGRLGFIAGVTPIIDSHHAAMSMLGERFIMLRPVMPNREQLAIAALRSAGREAQMRKELATAMHGFLRSRGSDAPIISDTVVSTLATVSDFITRARSGVVRDGYRRTLEYAPEPEAPTRFAKVLRALASGIALAHDSPAATDRELGLVLRVALDCLPIIRRRVIAALVDGAITDEGDGTLSTTAIAGAAQFSTATIRRALEDLQALNVMSCHKGGSGKADQWELKEEYVNVFTRLSQAACVCDATSDVSEKVFEPVSDPSEGVSATSKPANDMEVSDEAEPRVIYI